MVYDVRWTKTALRQLEKLDTKIAGRIINQVESISDDPFKSVKRLSGFNLYSLRVGDYRVIMSIQGKKMFIFVLEVGHRSSVYRKY
jgi:mRNA interferase RelE/StbE